MADEGGMGQRAANSAFYVGASQGVRLVLSTATTVVVSRILTPGDYGVLAMAGPVTGFILLFQDLGLGQAVIQTRAMSLEKLNSLFWINVLASALIAVVLMLIAPFVGWFYGDPRPAYITAASAATVLIGGTALQHHALMGRDMRFAALSIAEIAAAIATFVATIAAALMLRSFWALWFGSLVGSTVLVLFLWRLDPWRPSRRITISTVGAEARFGGNLTGFNLVNFLCRNADNVLIARFAGANELGLYDRSYRLMMLPLESINGPLSRVMLPVLARLRDEPERYRRAFLLSVRALMLAALPGIAVTVATSDQIITFLLGARWAAAGPIFFWLSLLGLLQPIMNATGWLFISSGRTGAMMRWGLFSGVVTLGGFALGLRWGAVGVAASLFMGTTLRLPILFAYCIGGTSVRARDLYSLMLLPMISAFITLICAQALLPHVAFVLALSLLLPLSYGVAVCVHATTRDGREFLATILRLTTSSFPLILEKMHFRRQT